MVSTDICLLFHAKLVLNLFRRENLFDGGYKVRRIKPCTQRQFTMFHHRIFS